MTERVSVSLETVAILTLETVAILTLDFRCRPYKLYSPLCVDTQHIKPFREYMICELARRMPVRTTKKALNLVSCLCISRPRYHETSTLMRSIPSLSTV